MSHILSSPTATVAAGAGASESSPKPATVPASRSSSSLPPPVYITRTDARAVHAQLQRMSYENESAASAAAASVAASVASGLLSSPNAVVRSFALASAASATTTAAQSSSASAFTFPASGTGLPLPRPSHYLEDTLSRFDSSQRMGPLVWNVWEMMHTKTDEDAQRTSATRPQTHGTDSTTHSRSNSESKSNQSLPDVSPTHHRHSSSTLRLPDHLRDDAAATARSRPSTSQFASLSAASSASIPPRIVPLDEFAVPNSVVYEDGNMIRWYFSSTHTEEERLWKEQWKEHQKKQQQQEEKQQQGGSTKGEEEEKEPDDSSSSSMKRPPFGIHSSALHPCTPLLVKKSKNMTAKKVVSALLNASSCQKRTPWQTQRPFDIVAIFYPKLPSGSSGRKLHPLYLTRATLEVFVVSRLPRLRLSGILQSFVAPQGSHNKVYRVSWTPSSTQIIERIASLPIDNPKTRGQIYDVDARVTTFERNPLSRPPWMTLTRQTSDSSAVGDAPNGGDLSSSGTLSLTASTASLSAIQSMPDAERKQREIDLLDRLLATGMVGGTDFLSAAETASISSPKSPSATSPSGHAVAGANTAAISPTHRAQEHREAGAGSSILRSAGTAVLPAPPSPSDASSPFSLILHAGTSSGSDLARIQQLDVFDRGLVGHMNSWCWSLAWHLKSVLVRHYKGHHDPLRDAHLPVLPIKMSAYVKPGSGGRMWLLGVDELVMSNGSPAIMERLDQIMNRPTSPLQQLPALRGSSSMATLPRARSSPKKEKKQTAVTNADVSQDDPTANANQTPTTTTNLPSISPPTSSTQASPKQLPATSPTHRHAQSLSSLHSHSSSDAAPHPDPDDVAQPPSPLLHSLVFSPFRLSVPFRVRMPLKEWLRYLWSFRSGEHELSRTIGLMEIQRDEVMATRHGGRSAKHGDSLTPFRSRSSSLSNSNAAAGTQVPLFKRMARESCAEEAMRRIQARNTFLEVLPWNERPGSKHTCQRCREEFELGADTVLSQQKMDVRDVLRRMVASRLTLHLDFGNHSQSASTLRNELRAACKRVHPSIWLDAMLELYPTFSEGKVKERLRSRKFYAMTQLVLCDTCWQELQGLAPTSPSTTNTEKTHTRRNSTTPPNTDSSNHNRLPSLTNPSPANTSFLAPPIAQTRSARHAAANNVDTNPFAPRLRPLPVEVVRVTDDLLREYLGLSMHESLDIDDLDEVTRNKLKQREDAYSMRSGSSASSSGMGLGSRNDLRMAMKRHESHMRNESKEESKVEQADSADEHYSDDDLDQQDGDDTKPEEHEENVSHDQEPESKENNDDLPHHHATSSHSHVSFNMDVTTEEGWNAQRAALRRAVARQQEAHAQLSGPSKELFPGLETEHLSSKLRRSAERGISPVRSIYGSDDEEELGSAAGENELLDGDSVDHSLKQFMDPPPDHALTKRGVPTGRKLLDGRDASELDDPDSPRIYNLAAYHRERRLSALNRRQKSRSQPLPAYGLGATLSPTSSSSSSFLRHLRGRELESQERAARHKERMARIEQEERLKKEEEERRMFGSPQQRAQFVKRFKKENEARKLRQMMDAQREVEAAVEEAMRAYVAEAGDGSPDMVDVGMPSLFASSSEPFPPPSVAAEYIREQGLPESFAAAYFDSYQRIMQPHLYKQQQLLHPPKTKDRPSRQSSAGRSRQQWSDSTASLAPLNASVDEGNLDAQGGKMERARSAYSTCRPDGRESRVLHSASNKRKSKDTMNGMGTRMRSLPTMPTMKATTADRSEDMYDDEDDGFIDSNPSEAFQREYARLSRIRQRHRADRGMVPLESHLSHHRSRDPSRSRSHSRSPLRPRSPPIRVPARPRSPYHSYTPLRIRYPISARTSNLWPYLQPLGIVPSLSSSSSLPSLTQNEQQQHQAMLEALARHLENGEEGGEEEKVQQHPVRVDDEGTYEEDAFTDAPSHNEHPKPHDAVAEKASTTVPADGASETQPRGESTAPASPTPNHPVPNSVTPGSSSKKKKSANKLKKDKSDVKDKRQSPSKDATHLSATPVSLDHGRVRFKSRSRSKSPAAARSSQTPSKQVDRNAADERMLASPSPASDQTPASPAKSGPNSSNHSPKVNYTSTLSALQELHRSHVSHRVKCSCEDVLGMMRQHDQGHSADSHSSSSSAAVDPSTQSPSAARRRLEEWLRSHDEEAEAVRRIEAKHGEKKVDNPTGTAKDGKELLRPPQDGAAASLPASDPSSSHPNSDAANEADSHDRAEEANPVADGNDDSAQPAHEQQLEEVMAPPAAYGSEHDTDAAATNTAHHDNDDTASAQPPSDGGWVRDLTQEGIEPNPSAETH